MAAFRSDLSFVSRPLCLVPLILCAAVLAVLPGCGGCRKTPQQIQAEREKKEAERRAKERERERRKKKPDVEIGKLVSLPHESKPDLCLYKPGHWTATALSAKANNFDLLGDLKMTVVDRRGKPIGLAGMPYTSTASREVALPKGQPKSFQSVLYVPPTPRDAFVSGRINARKGGRGAYETLHSLKRMPSYQYHLVVLARWPQSYKYLDGLDSGKNPSDLGVGDSTLGFYRVQLLGAEKETPLPLYGLFWTSIAYVLWDDAEPGALRPEAQVALLDWLHWGGGLVISGPDSLDTLHNSFLAPYLPAASAGTRELTEVDFDELNARWTLPVHGKPGLRLTPVEPWAGVRLDVHPQARAVPGTGGLLVERRVGRGRIVVSAFELDAPELIKWPGFDGFFNACLLGRPPRMFVGDEFETQVTWADGRFHQFDPRAVCKLRYFARDAGKKNTLRPRDDGPSYGDDLGTSGLTEGESRRLHGPDVASWSDFNAVANSAREALENAARIEIPERMFVVWVVGAYLLVLVPANWLAFRSIGRVEWAWAAAPVIAVVYTIVVIRMAQLDIGFARSSTEIAVVEMQGDYPRAHVTRYTALYTSLATAYDFRFEDRGAQVQPFPTVRKPEDFRLLPGEGLTELQCHYGRDARIRGFHVTSNTTGLVHSEQMIDLGGGISLEKIPGGGHRLTNRTAFALHGAGVLRRDESGRLETAWIGTLEPQDAVTLRFRSRRVTGRLWDAERNRSPLTAAGAGHGDLNLRGLFDLVEEYEDLRPAIGGGDRAPAAGRPGSGPVRRPATTGGGPAMRRRYPATAGVSATAGDPRELRPGDARLLAWFEERIPGLAVKPAAPQSRSAALVIANLCYGHGEDPRPDVNTRREKETDVYRAVGPDASEAPNTVRTR